MGKAPKEQPTLGPILINGQPMPDRTARAVRRMLERGATPCGVMHLLVIRQAIKAAKKAAKEAKAAIPPGPPYQM